MKARNIEDRLAVIGALVVLIGVSFAAEDALAKETPEITTTAVAIHNAAAETLEMAEDANADAARRAARSLALETVIDLDIKLEDTTSTLIANEK